MNFLVTGGAGFIGSHVCQRLLAEGHAVCAFDDLNDFYALAIKRKNLQEISRAGGSFQFVQGDLVHRGAVEALFAGGKFDQVIHLVGMVGEMFELLS